MTSSNCTACNDITVSVECATANSEVIVQVAENSGPASTDALPEGSTNLYHTASRAATAAPVQSVAGRTGAVTLAVADVSGAVSTTDARMTDAREWSAATATQAEAEAGTSTSRLAFTPLRVFQAVAAWWSGSAAKTKLDGIATGATANATDAQLRDRSTHTGTQAAATITGLGGAATLNVGTTAGTVAAGNDARLSDSRTPTAHVHAASDITSGTVAPARLGSGTASASTYLRGDQTYAEPVTAVNGSTGAVTLPTMVEFTTAGGPAGSTFDSFAGYRSYTWTFPAAAQYAIVEVQGAGSGGGSGRRGAAGTNRGGGGGGAAGPLRRVVWRLADLPSRTASFQVAAGGAGGAAVTANDTAGNQGSQPAAVTLIQGQWSGFPVLVRAAGAGNGGGGTTSGGSGGNGAAASSSDPFGGTSGGAGGVAAAGNAASSALAEASTGGGGGGGLDTANTTRAGGAGGGSQYIGASTGGAAGTAGGGAGTAGSGFGASICATGGGGGGSAVGAAGGAGGNGTKGSGGGGGGASENGFASGAGGNGGDGYIRVILF